MLRRTLCLASLTALATACGGSPPTQEEIDEARDKAEVALGVANQARSALELLGLLPVYTCGEDRRTFVGKAVESAQAKVGCVTASAEALDATTDAVILSFPQGGCEVSKRTVSGQTAFRYSGGKDRMELKADLRQLKVDGSSLQAEVGYGTCGDESRYFVLAEGPLPKKPEYTFRVDGQVGKRDGVPIFGSTSLVLNGPGEVTGPNGTGRLTLTELEYEIGEYAPKEGEVLLETADDHTVKAAFKTTLWRLGKMELTIDDREPVTVPIVR
ncbi:hypothetical protein [Hyalangium minutum]|uniref:Putative lipoprotein n=1 Tax=Hyalangium minutum TaxID=394096 RepID=A0A085WJF9_9BACT|nr:hypothetical protein [Hyalangium minutum]KFE67822.1 putative lipoprotein [Hyalangium minutum]